MSDNGAFMQKLNADILQDRTLAANEKPGQLPEEPDEGETLFMEDYVPFGMGEICGNFDGYDGDDAVVGLQVD